MNFYFVNSVQPFCHNKFFYTTKSVVYFCTGGVLLSNILNCFDTVLRLPRIATTTGSALSYCQAARIIVYYVEVIENR